MNLALYAMIFCIFVGCEIFVQQSVYKKKIGFVNDLMDNQISTPIIIFALIS